MHNKCTRIFLNTRDLLEDLLDEYSKKSSRLILKCKCRIVVSLTPHATDVFFQGLDDCVQYAVDGQSA
jgi:hypothetical protein